MDIEQIMIDFFEGETTPETEKQLFSVLSYDESMIEEFKNYWLLDKTAKKVVDTYRPPNHVTNAIFREFEKIYTNRYTKWSLSSIIKQNRFISYVLTSILAIALTVAVMLIFFVPENNNSENNAATKMLNQKLQGSVPQVPLVESKGNSTQTKMSVKNLSQPSVSGQSNTNENIFNLQTSQTKEQYMAFSSLPSASNRSIIKNQSLIKNLLYNENVFHKPFQFTEEKPLGIIIGLNGLTTWDIPKGKIPSLYYAPFNNTCLSLYYDISEHLRLGAEARQETFYNQYTGIDTNGKHAVYLQQSNFTTFGTKILYYPINKGSFNPYGGIALCFNPAGFVARPNAGIEYQPYPDIAFTLGAEYSYFWFNHQKNLFHTSKIGINYGIIKKF